MAKKVDKQFIFDARYFDNRKPPKERCVKTGHQTLGQGQMYAIQKSEQFGYCEVAEIMQYNVGTVAQEDIVRKWAYLNGNEVDVNVDHEAEKQKWIAAAHRKLPKLETETKENNMNTANPAKLLESKKLAKATEGKMVTKVTTAVAPGAKTTTKASASRSLEPKTGKGGTVAAGKGKKAPTKAAVKANGKAAKAKGGKKPAAGAKVPLAIVGATGSVLASFGLREGTKIANLGTLLCDNKGKMVKLKDAVKATYGSADEENFARIAMVVGGLRDMCKTKKIAWHIERAKDTNGNLTIGLKAGAE